MSPIARAVVEYKNKLADARERAQMPRKLKAPKLPPPTIAPGTTHEDAALGALERGKITTRGGEQRFVTACRSRLLGYSIHPA